MVVKRQCTFCADEIEPGTGTMFVKRDGSIFHFCSSSCRKQQLHLGRVGHRLKWTRAHALKVAAEQSHAAAAKATTAPAKDAAGPAKGRTRTRKPAAAGTDRAATPEAAPATSAPAEPTPGAAAAEPAGTPSAKPKAKSTKTRSPPAKST